MKKVAMRTQANATVGVDVRVEHLCLEDDLWWLVRIVVREAQSQLEGTALPGGVIRSEMAREK